MDDIATLGNQQDHRDGIQRLAALSGAAPKIAFGLWRLVALVLLTSFPAALSAQDQDWKEDWEIEAGFSIASDSDGYNFPVQLAFVPEPGPNPDDPLYFVVELRGKVKVVTNSREVRDFADVPAAEPDQELPSGLGEIGSAGICLDPAKGFVFVTFVYRDANGIFRNDIARFQTTPGTFGTSSVDAIRFTEIFQEDTSAPSHQIGPCQIYEDQLYVSVGDAERPVRSRDPDRTSGKILRMTVDGKPSEGNPFARNSQNISTRDYVYALGLRNPFGLLVRDGVSFLSDNGPSVDRFTRLVRGGDYLYDGSDWSIGSRADLVLSPAASPVAFDLYEDSLGFFPAQWKDHFFVTLSGHPGSPPGIGTNGIKSVIVFGYDRENETLTGSPQRFLAYRGSGSQLPVGLAFGPDGLYVVPLFPDNTGQSRILKVTYDPANAHPFDLADLKKFAGKGRHLMQEKGCFSCHTQRPAANSVAPNLNSGLLRTRLAERLSSAEYAQRISEVDALDDEYLRSFAEQRRAVMDAPANERSSTWIRAFLSEPMFDNPEVQMPNLNLAPEEIEIIADYLVNPPPQSLSERLDVLIGPARHRYWIVALGLGGVLGMVVTVIGSILLRRRAR